MYRILFETRTNRAEGTTQNTNAPPFPRRDDVTMITASFGNSTRQWRRDSDLHLGDLRRAGENRRCPRYWNTFEEYTFMRKSPLRLASSPFCPSFMDVLLCSAFYVPIRHTHSPLFPRDYDIHFAINTRATDFLSPRVVRTFRRVPRSRAPLDAEIEPRPPWILLTFSRSDGTRGLDRFQKTVWARGLSCQTRPSSRFRPDVSAREARGNQVRVPQFGVRHTNREAFARCKATV